VNGRQIAAGNFNGNTVSIDLSVLKGLFFIQIENGMKTQIEKVIIQ